MSTSDEKSILTCWQTNAAAWIKAVRQQEIESRRLVTDTAIIDAVLSLDPKHVLDVGCGEGWLARELSARNIDVLGVDAVPELIDNATGMGGGRFEVMSYEELARGKLNEQFDVVVCNFSLLGKRSVEGLFTAMPSLLNRAGYFVVQTLHPDMFSGNGFCQEGWQQGSWQGFNDDFTAPARWYFRTADSWLALFRNCGFEISEIRVPVHPETHQKSVIIFIARLMS